MSLRLPPLVVLKFGSSVLPSPAHLDVAVEEIYRARRAGDGVVAVVSAFGETTDALTRELGPDPDGVCPRAASTLLGTGEARAAALLALELDRRGLPARLLDAGEIGLLAEGDRRSADPCAVDPEVLRAVIARGEIAVVPGFVARHVEGGPCLLGRGGSDLTAIVLAEALGARCRLLKDTDGLYDRDPRQPGPPPRRFATLTFADAARLDAQVLQPRARRRAERSGLDFEVARPGSPRRTRVGATETALDAASPTARPLRVAIAGLGTVGGALARRLAGDPRFEIVAAAVRDPARARPPELAALHPVSDLGDLVAAAPDVVVELVGGTGDAARLVARSLEEGIAVVTANKALLAAEGSALAELARRSGTALLGTAAVGGAVPVLETIAALSRTRRAEVVEIAGVLNGTTSDLLERGESGADLTAALAAARAAGLCEADPARDLSGLDALEKLRLAVRALDPAAPLIGAARRGLGGADLERARRARDAGERLRLVARARRGRGGFRLRVSLERLAADAHLAGGRGPENRVAIRFADGSDLLLAGTGAGALPTAEAVLADLLDLWRASAHRAEGVA